MIRAVLVVKKRSVVMYNMIFPVLLMLTPLFWPVLGLLIGPFVLMIIFVLIFGNLGVDWLVVRLAMHWQKIENAKEKAMAVLWRVCLCGFAADTIAGSALMWIFPRLLNSDSDWFYQNIEKNVFYGNLFENIWAILYVSAGILIAIVAIYCFNRFYCLKKANLTLGQTRLTALALAVLTAPWLFLLPTSLL